MINLDKMQEFADPDYSQEWRVYLAAMEYAKSGINLVPIRPNSKILPPKSQGITYAQASAKPSTIERWFHPEHGQFRGWNIGIACGKEDGVFAVDMDQHGGADGIEEMVELERANDQLPEGPMARTPTGGVHLLFRWQENCTSSTAKIGKGIDTRGGSAAKCGGHIVVFPSTVDGNMYEWERGGDLPHVPPWVMKCMGLAWKKPPTRPGRGNEEVDGGDLEVQIPITQVEAMLRWVDPDDTSYDDWLRIGQAIHSQHPNKAGLAAWDTWSQQGKRYEQGECSLRWNGFDETGPVRIGTLYYHAKSGGWNPGPDDIGDVGPISEIIQRMNSQYAVVVTGGKIRILREKPNPDPVLGFYDLMPKDDFRVLYSNDLHAYMTPEGKTVVRSSADIWLASEERRTYPNGMGLYPGEHPDGWYNTWAGFSFTPEDGDWTLLKQHILEVICNGDEDLYEWVLDWMADGVQDPANPKGCALVMRGQEGTGKGTLATMYGRLFGPHFRHLVDDSHLTGNFNAHIMDALIVYADEILWGGNKKSAGKLKGLVTERYILGERKGVDAVMYRNMIHLLVASNEDWVIPAGPQSRRWCVLDISNHRRNDREWFTGIRRQMDDGGYNAMLAELLDRHIESNLTRAPETVGLRLQRLELQANDPTAVWWKECIEEGFIDVIDEEETDFTNNSNVWPKLVDRTALFDAYMSWCNQRKVQRPEGKIKFYRRMEEYGLKPIRPRVGKGEKRRRLFKVPDITAAEGTFTIVSGT